MTSLKRNFLYQLLITALNTVAPLLTFPYVSRILGPENIGRINFIDYTTQFLLLFAAFGVPMYGVREVARNRTNLPALRKIVSELLSIQVIFSFISIIIFVLLLLLTPHAFLNKTLLLLAVVNIAMNAFSLDWVIQGFEDFAFFTKRSFMVRIAMLVAIFTFIKEPDDYALYYLIFVSGSLLSVGFSINYAYQKNIRFTTLIKLTPHFKALFLFFLTTAAISIYTFFDTFLLGIISGSVAVGLFTTSLKSVKLAQNFVNNLGGVVLPRMSYLYKTNDEPAINQILYKSLHYVLTVTIPLSIGFFLLAPEFIFLIAGTKYLSAVSTLKILSILPVVVGLSNVFGIQILMPMGKERKVLIAVISGSLVSVGLCLILCPWYFQNGAAIACIAAEVTVTIIMGYFAQLYQALPLSRSLLFSIVISSLLFIPIIFLFRLLFQGNALLIFLSAAVSCITFYFVFQLWVFKNGIIIEITHHLLNPIKKLMTHHNTKTFL